jgi:glutaconate CoA-transferase subunit B
MSAWSRDEMMTVAAARRLNGDCVCFVGIGLPSAACNLARLTHAPDIVLIYESGTIGTRPNVLPLSIGDGELAETALCIVPLPEVFSYLLQGGRVDVGFLGAAQIDRFGNLNSTVVGPYASPDVRLPGAGGASEIAAHAKETFVVMRATTRSFVQKLDFCTSMGFLEGGDARGRSAACGGGPKVVITDFGLLTPAEDTSELTLTALFPDTDVKAAKNAVGWPLAVAERLETLAPPTVHELRVLRDLNARTQEAHRRPVEPPI